MFQTLSLTKGYANQPDKWNKKKKIKGRDSSPPLPPSQTQNVDPLLAFRKSCLALIFTAIFKFYTSKAK